MVVAESMRLTRLANASSFAEMTSTTIELLSLGGSADCSISAKRHPRRGRKLVVSVCPGRPKLNPSTALPKDVTVAFLDCNPAASVQKDNSCEAAQDHCWAVVASIKEQHCTWQSNDRGFLVGRHARVSMSLFYIKSPPYIPPRCPLRHLAAPP